MPQQQHFTDQTTDDTSAPQTINDAFTLYYLGTPGEGKLAVQMSPVGEGTPVNIDVLPGPGVYTYPPYFGDLTVELAHASATTSINVFVET